ncbi:MAG: alpha/beta fold hydrolase [Elusimicrobia bacterium]|nr:alpha/beta fold hydrolase [Elusimicrobiota bacterium]
MMPHPRGLLASLASAFICASAGAQTPESLRFSADALPRFEAVRAASTIGRRPTPPAFEPNVEIPVAGRPALTGTLAAPPNAGPTTPAIVLLAGSGANTMDGDAPSHQTVDNKPAKLYKDVSDAFVRRGFVVLRYSKRGVAGWDAEKEEPILSDGPVENLAIGTLAEDAAAAVRSLRQGASARRRVILVGHSEGTRLAPMVAERERIDGMILLGAMASTLESLGRYQAIERPLSMIRDVYDVDKDGFISEDEARASLLLYLLYLSQDKEKVGRASIESIGEALEERYANSHAEYSATAWYKSHMALEPNVAALPRYRGPILIMQGGEDENTPPSEARLLQKALRDSRHPDATVRVYPGLGHLFSPPRPGSRAATGGPIDPGVLDAAAQWAAARTLRSGR